jgi:putative ABC transport system permease protein
MRLIDLFYLVGSNIVRLKLRVLMTSGGVMIGATAIILLVAVGLGLQQSFADSMGKIGDLTILWVSPPMRANPYENMTQVRRSSQPQQALVLSRNLIEEIETYPGVLAVTPHEQLILPAYLRYQQIYERPALITGIDPAKLPFLNLPVESGSTSLLARQAVIGPEQSAGFFDLRRKQLVEEQFNLLDETLDIRILKPGEYADEASAPASLPAVRMKVKVIGQLERTGGVTDYRIYLPLDEVEQVLSWAYGGRIDRERLGYSELLVKVDSPHSAIAVGDRLEAMGFHISSPRKTLEQANSFFVTIQVMLAGIGAIALLVASFGIANTMIMATYERIQEIGLLKALGARNADVMLVFLCEASTIGVVGGLAGAGLSLASARVLNQHSQAILKQASLMPLSGPPVPFEGNPTIAVIPTWLVVFAVLFSLVIGVLAGFYPAVRAASLEPLEALRHE